MMRRSLVAIAVAATVVGGWQISGCVSLIPPQTIPFQLGSSGDFNVEPGVAKQNVLTITDFDTAGFSVATGSLTIDPSAISVTPGGAGGKGLVNLQANTLTVSVRIDAPGTEDTVCDTGELYGPYAIELDENFNVVSVTPSTINLTATTVNLLNSGAFVLCIDLEANFTGVITISQLEVTVRIG